MKQVWTYRMPPGATEKQIESAKKFKKEWRLFVTGPISHLRYRLTDEFLIVAIQTNTLGVVFISKHGKWRRVKDMKPIKKAYEAEIN